MKSLMVLIALILVAAPIAVAQNTRCFPRDTVVKTLNERYSEYPSKRGITAAGNVLEWYQSLESGGWTVTLTTPAGKTCVMAFGQTSMDIDPPIPGDEM